MSAGEAPHSRTLLVRGCDAEGDGGEFVGSLAPRGYGRRAIATAAATLVLVVAAAAAFGGLVHQREAEEMSGVSSLSLKIEQPPGATNGDAIPFKNVHLVMRGYNVYYADPSPATAGSAESPAGSSSFPAKPGMYLSGHAGGDSSLRDLDASKKRCVELGSACGGITCDQLSRRCKVRAGTTLKRSPTAQVSYLQVVAPRPANVAASSAKEGLNMDPGLRKPVFALSYERGKLTGDRRRTQPDGYHATVDTGCSKVFTSKSIRNEYEYTKSTGTEIGLTAGVEASVGVQFPPPDDSSKKKDDGGSGLGASAGACLSASVSGTLSHTNQQIRKEGSFREQRMERSVAKCASYVAAIEYGHFPKTHPELQKRVDGLGGSNEKFWDLFDEFGTHFLTSVKMGARSTVTSYFRTDEYEKMETTIKGLGVSVGVAASASAGVSVGTEDVGTSKEVSASVGASASLLSPKEKTAAEEIKKYTKSLQVSDMGPRLGSLDPSAWWEAVRENPVPIRFDKREICLHPVFKGEAQKQCAAALKGYCQGRLAKDGAPCNGIAKRECMNDLDCKEDHVCRAYLCKKEPMCEVTLCQGSCSGGNAYVFETVTASKAPHGKIFDLQNGNWWNRVESIRMSTGCRFVEAVDDDGACQFGKGDNGRYYSSAKLPYDLEHDVCMIKVFANEVPQVARRLGARNNSVGHGVSSDDSVGEVPGLAELNRRLAEQFQRRRALSSAINLTAEAAAVEPAPEPEREGATLDASGASAASPMPAAPLDIAATEVRAARTKLEVAASRAVLVAPNSSRRLGRGRGRALAPAPVDKHKYVKNIGKAMYGYNHFFGAPLSAEFAGTDPGFVHRAIWADAYSKGNLVTFEDMKEIPKTSSSKKSTKKPTSKGVAEVKAVTSYSKLYNHYLGGYAAGDSQSRGVDASKARCEELGSKCGGITCNSGESSCTVRTGPQAKASPSGEVSYLKGAATRESFTSLSGYYLSGYAAGDSQKRGRAESQARCSELGGSCGGVTCDRSGTPCTVRAGSVPFRSPSGEVTYQKIAGRRLSTVPETEDDVDAPPQPLLHAGPPRQLQQSELKAPDGWKVRMAKSTVCEKSFSSKTIKSAFAYQQEMKDSMSMGLDIGFVSFGYSSESKEFIDSNGKQKKMLVTTTAECADFVAEIDDLKNNPPPTNPSFQFVVDVTKSEAEFYALFDMFGLSFPTSLMFGARYGFSRYIDEQNYMSFTETSGSTSVSVGVSYTVGVDKGGASAGITVSAEVTGTKTESTSTREAVSKYFSEVQEFSVGKRMPDSGGISAWVKDIGGEPMPTRFALESICEHPAFGKAGTKADCLKYSGSYCEKHLQRMDESMSCEPEPEPQCLWDLDCGPHKTCEEGSCVSEPDCWLKAWKDDNFRGSSQTFGPIYRRERPTGEIFELGRMGRDISSVEVSGGCEEVILMDEDKCRVQYEDNAVIELRRTNSNERRGDLPYDIDNDVCKAKLLAKTKWFK